MNRIDLPRRDVLQGIATFAGVNALGVGKVHAATGKELDWTAIRALYPRQEPYINLDNGCISPARLAVQQKFFEAFRFANENPCFNLFEKLDAAEVTTKLKLSQLVDCDPGEVSLNRCTTEGLCIAIFGMPLAAGDEVILSHWDYPSMINAWQQRAKREGLVLRFASFGLMDSDQAIVDAYAELVTPRTRAIHFTHMIHWTGRTLPAVEICRLAQTHNIRTVVDAAQSVAHIPLSFRQMGCDYLATSFHKWLSGPVGTGMLVIKADRIAETWPLFGEFETLPGADKFGLSNLGTYNSAAPYVLGDCIDFHNMIGSQRKLARLQELSRYWVDRAREIEGFQIHTPMDSPELGGVASFSLAGIPVEIVERRLRDEFKIQTRKRVPEGLRAIRVSPQLYSTKSELDELVLAIRKIAARRG